MTYKSYMKKNRKELIAILFRHHPKFGSYISELNINHNLKILNLASVKKRLLTNKDFLNLKIVDPFIRETFAKITEESSRHGDFSETGWINKEGVNFSRKDPEYLSDALKHILDNYATNKSNSHFSSGTWYSTEFEMDINSGESEERSFHLVGFTTEEQLFIFNGVTNA